MCEEVILFEKEKWDLVESSFSRGREDSNWSLRSRQGWIVRDRSQKVSWRKGCTGHRNCIVDGVMKGQNEKNVFSDECVPPHACISPDCPTSTLSCFHTFIWHCDKTASLFFSPFLLPPPFASPEKWSSLLSPTEFVTSRTCSSLHTTKSQVSGTQTITSHVISLIEMIIHFKEREIKFNEFL